ncbi:MAG TPA: hydroxymethylbilane synthase [Methylomirabilota bacterium]|jgi:hydroxymethylbilane synthase
MRLATRGSALALAQARSVADRLAAVGIPVEVVAMRTEGDRLAEARLAAVGGKGLFVREIEEALLRGDVDVAVHSLKDLPAELPRGLALAAFPERADAHDVLVARAPMRFAGLPPGAVLGTSSPRRRALALAARPDLRVEPIRGNVDTRLRKLEAGDYDAIVLAAAGLARLGVTPRHVEALSPEVFVPAVGQGALAVEARVDDARTLAALRAADHEPTRVCALAERAFLGRLGASCVTPMAAHARLSGGRLVLDAVVASEDGRMVLRESTAGPPQGAEALGVSVAEALLARGAAGVVALRPAGVGDGR